MIETFIYVPLVSETHTHIHTHSYNILIYPLPEAQDSTRLCNVTCAFSIYEYLRQAE